MIVSGTTRVAGVIGAPIGQSLSPAIHNAAFRAAALDWLFAAFEVAPGQAATALAGMRALGLGGLSVTMPHKADVADAVDVLTSAAERLHAVNTVVPRPDGGLEGHNTDGGAVWVRTGPRNGGAWLGVSNDGPVVSPDEIERLYEPFERLGTGRTAWGDGFGLGLCIVRAVAAAHDATLRTAARPTGGLSIEVRFPASERAAAEEPVTWGAGTDPAAGSGPAVPGGGHPEGDAGETGELVHAARSDH